MGGMQMCGGFGAVLFSVRLLAGVQKGQVDPIRKLPLRQVAGGRPAPRSGPPAVASLSGSRSARSS
jgi:hypothetical protein